jgi:hypothetical protein
MQSAYCLFLIYKKNPQSAIALLESSNGVTQSEIAATLKSLNNPTNAEAVIALTPTSSISGELEAAGDLSVDASVSTDITSDFGQGLPKQDLQQKNSFAVVRTNQGAKFDKKIAKGFVQNLSLQLGNKAAGQIVFNHSEAQTLKSLLEGLL